MRGATLYLVVAILSSPDTNTAASFIVSETFSHTLHRNGSVSVTCQHDNEQAKEIDAKLKSGEDIVCELEKEGCSLTWAGRSVTFTLWNLTAGDEDKLYGCTLTQIDPVPIRQGKGKATKLFQGSKIPFPPPRDIECAPASTSTPSNVPPDPHLSMDPLVWVLTAVTSCVCLYGFIITILFLKLKVSREEVLYDTLRYVPVQQRPAQGQAWSVRGPREVNEEYMDMREVQPKSWPQRDLNHNSQVPAHDFTV